jgi:hypothetical protein
MLVHQPSDRDAVGAELGGDLGQQPRPCQQPVGQVRANVGEAELGRPRSEALLGGRASLAGQLLRSWWQPHPSVGEGLLDVHSLTPSSAAS